MSAETEWISVKDQKPHNGQKVIAKYEGVYTDRVCRFWRGSTGDEHFGGFDERDGRGSQPATHWRPSQPGRAGSETAGWIGVIKKMGEEQRTPSSPSQVTQSAKPDERALVRLESDLRSIKDDANENGAGNPPDGYGYLDQNSQAIADACFRLGLDSMETALSNWIYDQRNLAPAPSTPEGLTSAMEAIQRIIDNCEAAYAHRVSAITTLKDAKEAVESLRPFIPASTTEGRK